MRWLFFPQLSACDDPSTFCSITFSASAWAATTAYSVNNVRYGTPPTRQNSTAYTIQDMIVYSGNRYQCISAGTTASSPPTFDTTIGNTTVDGTVTWKRVANTTGHLFKCTTGGTSGGTEPTWDNTIGNTTNDGTVVWTRITNIYSWCEESWTLPADSALAFEVCPTTYRRGFYFGGYREDWLKSVGGNPFAGGTGVGMLRQDTGYYKNLNLILDFGLGYAKHNRLNTGLNNKIPTTFNPLTSVAFPNSTDYLITDEYFTSYSEGGVTYTTTRGNNW